MKNPRPVTEEELIMAEDVEADRRRARAILAQLRERHDITGEELLVVLCWLGALVVVAIGLGLWANQ
jgi:hypothetical protein